jgi:hypothetical protein
MQLCLWVLVEVFRSCESLLVDDVYGANAQRILGEKLLATSAVGSDINNIDQVALVKVVGGPSLARSESRRSSPRIRLNRQSASRRIPASSRND